MQAVAQLNMEAKMKAFKMTDAVRGFTFGDPVPTETVVLEKQYREDALPFSIEVAQGKGRFSMPLTKEDRVYGLGPNLGGINKRGRCYESYCTDDPLHHEDKTTLYGAHNFFVLEDDDVATGFFIDFPGRIRYDVGFTAMETISVEIFGEDFDLYLIVG